MMWDQTADFESDPRFPSGPWEGFWTSDAGVGSMKLYLEFVCGRVRGEGSDRVGTFDITGRYWPRSGIVVLRKKYRGQHKVWYRGRPFGPYLRGGWRIPSTTTRGHWRIRPIDEDEFEITHLEIETEHGSVVIVGDIKDATGRKKIL